MHRLPAVAAAIIALLLVAAPAAGAAPGGTGFDAQPAKGSSTDPSGGWFSVPLAAGARVEQALAVSNTSPEPVELEVAPVGATTMDRGGASYAAPGSAQDLTADWIEVSEPRLRLEPGQSRHVRFVVDVPRDARPGDHLAGISVAAPVEAGRSAQLSNGASASLDLRTRRVVAVRVAVPGPASAEVDVRGLQVEVRPAGPQLEISLANTGQLLTRGKGVLTLPEDDVRLEFDLDTFVPQTSIAYPLPWPAELAAGERPARVEIQHDGRTAVWQGSLDVAGDVVEAAREVLPAQAGAAPAAPGAASGPSGVTLGAAVVGGVALALGAQTALRTARRRR